MKKNLFVFIIVFISILSIGILGCAKNKSVISMDNYYKALEDNLKKDREVIKVATSGDKKSETSISIELTPDETTDLSRLVNLSINNFSIQRAKAGLDSLTLPYPIILSIYGSGRILDEYQLVANSLTQQIKGIFGLKSVVITNITTGEFSRMNGVEGIGVYLYLNPYKNTAEYQKVYEQILSEVSKTIKGLKAKLPKDMEFGFGVLPFSFNEDPSLVVDIKPVSELSENAHRKVVEKIENSFKGVENVRYIYSHRKGNITQVFVHLQKYTH